MGIWVKRERLERHNPAQKEIAARLRACGLSLPEIYAEIGIAPTRILKWEREDLEYKIFYAKQLAAIEDMLAMFFILKHMPNSDNHDQFSNISILEHLTGWRRVSKAHNKRQKRTHATNLPRYTRRPLSRGTAPPPVNTVKTRLLRSTALGANDATPEPVAPQEDTQAEE